jgi:hypothetical protein
LASNSSQKNEEVKSVAIKLVKPKKVVLPDSPSCAHLLKGFRARSAWMSKIRTKKWRPKKK